MRCRICDANHAKYDSLDNNWYCEDCLDSISDTLMEYPEVEGLLEDDYDYEE